MIMERKLNRVNSANEGGGGARDGEGIAGGGG